MKSELVVDRLAAAQRAGQWAEIDPLLDELRPSFGPDLVAPLLSTLVDDIAAEARAFGIVHLAESTDDRLYVLGLLNALPGLTETSPRWARTLLARVVNSPGTLKELVDLAPGLSDEQSHALLGVTGELEEWRPDKFLHHAVLIRNSLIVKPS